MATGFSQSTCLPARSASSLRRVQEDRRRHVHGVDCRIGQSLAEIGPDLYLIGRGLGGIARHDP